MQNVGCKCKQQNGKYEVQDINHEMGKNARNVKPNSWAGETVFVKCKMQAAKHCAHPSGVEVEWLPLLIGIQQFDQVSVRKEDAALQERVRRHASDPLDPVGHSPQGISEQNRMQIGPIWHAL
jgi:hypothetical protein